jgi:hypothetical protein
VEVAFSIPVAIDDSTQPLGFRILEERGLYA